MIVACFTDIHHKWYEESHWNPQLG